MRKTRIIDHVSESNVIAEMDMSNMSNVVFTPGSRVASEDAPLSLHSLLKLNRMAERGRGHATLLSVLSPHQI